MKKMFYLPIIIRTLLIATALTSLILSNASMYSLVFPKIVFYRVLIELALVLAIIYLLLMPKQDFKKIITDFVSLIRGVMRKPLFVFLLLFFISIILSTLFAENIYRAFWGDLERGIGFFGFLHFFVFLILSLIFFNKKEWEYYFKTSVLVGLLLIGYAFLQYFGLSFLFLKPAQQSRPESLIGNSSFLATHLILLATFAGALMLQSFNELKKIKNKLNYFWLSLYFVTLILSFLTIFITGTRGAVLGIGFGIFALFVYFAIRRGENRFVRITSFVVIASVLLGSSIFWLTRSNDIWQNIPGLNRLAKTELFDVNDASTQFRLITWKLSYEAFKEKPLFGWGPENYLNAYEKHYDPTYALYGEAWLDRAHNTFFDFLVMQGIIGVFAYYGLIVSLLYLVFKKLSLSSHSFYLGGVFGAGIIAYVIQDLFVFDQIVSYSLFFALVGYVIYLQNENQASHHLNLTGHIKTNHLIVLKGILFIIILASTYSIYAYNFYPYYQGKLFKKSPGISQNAYEVEAAIKKATTPYNFAQFNIRSQGIDTIFMEQYFDNEKFVSNPKFRPIGTTLITKMAELVDKEPYDVRANIRLAEMLEAFSKGLTEAEIVETQIYEKSEKLIRDALLRAPHRQEMYYQLSFILSAQKKYNEAIIEAQKGIDLEPRVARSHYHLGLVLALAGRNKEAQSAIAKAEELAPNFERFLGSDLANIAIFYKKWGFDEKLSDLVYRTLIKINENRIGHVFKRENYEEALRYYINKKNAFRAIPIAEYLGENFSDLSDEMAKTKILLEKNDWGELLKNNIVISDVSISYNREYYENELRKNVLKKDKINAIKTAEYLLANYKEYSIEMGIDVILDLLKKEKWDILNQL